MEGIMKTLLLLYSTPTKENLHANPFISMRVCALHVLILMQTYFKITVQQLKPTAAATENTL